MDTPGPHIDNCRYEIQEQKKVPVWHTGIYRPISSTGLTETTTTMCFSVSCTKNSVNISPACLSKLTDSAYNIGPIIRLQFTA
jgi:hypothetical protein